MSNKYRTYLILFLLFVVSSFPIRVSADQAMDMINISCIPESDYFDIEVKTYHNLVYEDETAIKQPKNKARSKIKILAKHGIFFPRDLVYECKLPSGTYKIVGSQPMPSPRGQCCASPTPSISIWRNKILWIDNVLFGDDCFGNATIKRIEIAEGNMSLYFMISDNTLLDPIRFKYFAPGEIHDKAPIKQETINEFIEFDNEYQLYKSKQQK